MPKTRKLNSTKFEQQNQEEQKLIRLVKHQEGIWNKHHPKYKDIEWKSAAWLKIANEMKRTCKRQILMHLNTMLHKDVFSFQPSMCSAVGE